MLAGFAGTPARGQAPVGGTAAAPLPFSVTVTSAYVSQYVFRGQRLSGQSFEPSVEINYGDLGAGVWANAPLTGRAFGGADAEVDPYAYFAMAISHDLSVVPGFTFYTYPRADTHGGSYRSTFEPNVAVSWNFHGVKLTPKAYYDFAFNGPTVEVSAAYALPLEALGTELDFNVQGGDYLRRDTVNGAQPAVKSWGRYWGAGVSLPYPLSHASRLLIGFSYTRGENAYAKSGTLPKAPDALAAGRGVITLSYSCTFGK